MTQESYCESASFDDPDSLAAKFALHQPRLRRMLEARMTEELATRVAPSDVLQDVFVEAQRRINDFHPNEVPFFIWLRALTSQRLIQLYRFHVQTAKRSTMKERQLMRYRPDASADSLAKFFIDKCSSVAQGIVKKELMDEIRKELDALDPLDREIISLRHFEQLSNEEAAAALEMNASTVSTRHLRALKSLRKRLVQNDKLRDHLAELLG